MCESQLDYKKRYTGHDQVPYYKESICIAWGHVWVESGGGHVCKQCKMTYEYFKLRTIKHPDYYQ